MNEKTKTRPTTGGRSEIESAIRPDKEIDFEPHRGTSHPDRPEEILDSSISTGSVFQFIGSWNRN